MAPLMTMSRPPVASRTTAISAATPIGKPAPVCGNSPAGGVVPPTLGDVSPADGVSLGVPDSLSVSEGVSDGVSLGVSDGVSLGVSDGVSDGVSLEGVPGQVCDRLKKFCGGDPVTVAVPLLSVAPTGVCTNA